MFKLVGTLVQGAEPYKYLPVTVDEVFARGEALVVTSGLLTKCAATVTPTYIAAAAAVANNGPLPVFPVRETDEYSVPCTAQVAATGTGGVVTLHTTGLSVTGTAGSGVFRLTGTDGLDPSQVVGHFEV